jgi:hypothetical protein
MKLISHLDAVQEKNEQHSEPYLRYGERAEKFFRQQCTKSLSKTSRKARSLHEAVWSQE